VAARRLWETIRRLKSTVPRVTSAVAWPPAVFTESQTKDYVLARYIGGHTWKPRQGVGFVRESPRWSVLSPVLYVRRTWNRVSCVVPLGFHTHVRTLPFTSHGKGNRVTCPSRVSVLMSVDVRSCDLAGARKCTRRVVPEIVPLRPLILPGCCRPRVCIRPTSHEVRPRESLP